MLRVFERRKRIQNWCCCRVFYRSKSLRLRSHALILPTFFHASPKLAIGAQCKQRRFDTVSRSLFLGIAFDAASDKSKKEKFAIEVRYLVDYRPDNAFLTSVHARRPDAEMETELILSALAEVGFDGVVIACSSDGASTNTGKKNGIFARLGVTDFSHCVPHVAALVADKLESSKRSNGSVLREGVPAVDGIVKLVKHIAWEI